MIDTAKLLLLDLLIDYVMNSYAEMDYIVEALTHDPRVSRLNDHIDTAKRLMVIHRFVNHLYSLDFLL
jgi:hypothetical protein